MEEKIQLQRVENLFHLSRQFLTNVSMAPVSRLRGRAFPAGGAAQPLSRVLPDQQRPTHVHVEGAGDAPLRDFHTHVQLRDQRGQNPLAFVSEGKREEGLVFLH